MAKVSFIRRSTDNELKSVAIIDGQILVSADGGFYTDYGSTRIPLIQSVTNKEDISNKVTSLSSSSTNIEYPSAKCVYDALKSKQDNLTAGENIIIKNNVISSTASSGVTDYENLNNKPKINNMELIGDRTLQELGIINFSGNYDDLKNKPSIPTNSNFTLAGLGEKNYNSLTNKPTIPTNGDFTLAGLKERNYTSLIGTPDLTLKENVSNKVTSISATSTDTEYPSAKCVYDLVGNIETLLGGI